MENTIVQEYLQLLSGVCKMKLFVLNGRRLLVYFLITLALLLAAYFLIITGPGTFSAFRAQKEVPIYSVETPDKKISVTFDCAWGADDIPDILNTLKESKIKATFFMVGEWAEKNAECVKLIAEDGHDIANHSYSHFRMGSLGKEKIASEIKQCGDLLEKLSGVRCELFRAPYGDYNNLVLNQALQLGYFTIQWDVDSLDWKPGISKSEIVQRVRSKTRSGSIILFHNDTPHTAKLLPEIISEMQAEGYTFVPVSKLIFRENYYIDHQGRQQNNT
jgi:polysaccharide deacetylase family sporulation protein PdaB